MAVQLGLQAVHLLLCLPLGGEGRVIPAAALRLGPAEVGVPLPLQPLVFGLKAVPLPLGLLGQPVGLTMSVMEVLEPETETSAAGPVSDRAALDMENLNSEYPL